MNLPTSRRKFLKTSTAAGAMAGFGDLSFLWSVRPGSENDPLVRMLEETPRERLLEDVAARIERGLEYRDLLAALLLAGVRNIKPRPVGFKFHAVLVVNSIHLASLASSGPDRWLPIFWALDYFKESQARDVSEGDWTMKTIDKAPVPEASKARRSFIEAMDNWDEEAADVAVAGLARSAGAQELFNLFCRYGIRDFRDIGHKAIYVANAWRSLQYIGWGYAEPVFRSLAYALLDHEGENPAKRDAAPDRPWRFNQARAAKIRASLRQGAPDAVATSEMLSVLREASNEEACAKVVEQLNRGVGTQSIWDAYFLGAGELLMRQPGIVSLHAMTSTNALHFAYRTTTDDEVRKLILLQNAAFITLFRSEARAEGKGVKLDLIEPAAHKKGSQAASEIFEQVSKDRMTAARNILAQLDEGMNPEILIDQARRLTCLKGETPHDYKFSSAVLEDFYNVSPRWRNHYLAASAFNLRGSVEPDNELVKRTRAAMKG
jgi:hypothetical protein